MSLERLSKLSVQFIQRRLDDLRTADLKTVGINDLKTKLYDLLRAYTSVSLRIEKDKPIFRARKHREGERATLIESVEGIYPKAIYLTRLNRASREREPVYYFSADVGIALHEVKTAVGDVLTVLECGPREHTGPLLIPIGIHEMARKHNAKIGGGLPERGARIRAFLKDDAESIHKHELIDKFIADEFLKVVDEGQEHLYKLTIAIAELLFSFETDDGPIDGITYPSIASGQINANVALLPHAFHRIYKPVACERMKIEGALPNSGFNIEGRKARRIGDDGVIEW